MLFYRCRMLSSAAILAIAASLHITPRAGASIPSRKSPPVTHQLAQAPTQEQLDRQREAERVLKENERIKREIRERDKLRERNHNRPIRNEVAPIIITPFYPPGWNPGAPVTAPVAGSTDRSFRILGSVGFKDGNTSSSIGLRWNNIGLELGGIFNQDSLPGAVNNFSLPSNFFFTDFGNKKLSPQWGADLLGFVDVSPRVAVYGSVGIYFQTVGRIAQSLATNELYKQTESTNTTGAVGGGVLYNVSDGFDIGVGYHSLRGVTVRLGISF